MGNSRYLRTCKVTIDLSRHCKSDKLATGYSIMFTNMCSCIVISDEVTLKRGVFIYTPQGYSHLEMGMFTLLQFTSWYKQSVVVQAHQSSLHVMSLFISYIELLYT